MKRPKLLSEILKLFATIGLLVALVIGLTASIKGLSPLGLLVSPSVGIWRHQPTGSIDVARGLSQAVTDAGLAGVSLEIDANEVPHLKSESDDAVYFAQGYVTAYYRLWQMDFLSRITAGEVSELLGASALPIDRFFRRLRLPAAAHASYEVMASDPLTRGPLAAFTKGVNARILEMNLSTLPIEYRLFGVLPRPWTDERAAHLLKFMTWQLSGYLYDFRMTATKQRLNPELFQKLFSTDDAAGAILELRNRVGVKKTALNVEWPTALTRVPRFRLPEIPFDASPEPENGSNNWAVPARQMANGRALLANDTHLSYGLPALWFSIQLTTPKMNVYGASLPGAPGVIVGFNDKMGWAVTNGTDDVLDWSSLRFRDARKQEYFFDNTWRPVTIREEIIHVAGGGNEIVKSRDTHVGPIVSDEIEDADHAAMTEIPSGLAVQWMGYRPSNELRSFLLLNRAGSAGDCVTALQNYVAPAQNFVCADRAGKIVFRHAGVFPNRHGRDGRFVNEVATDSDLWQGTLPPEDSAAFETKTQTIVTANQAPFGTAEDSKFGWFFAAPFRAIDIRNKIEAKKKWKPEDMIGLQASRTSLLAEQFKIEVERLAGVQPLQTALETIICPRSERSASTIAALHEWTTEHSPDDQTSALVEEWIRVFEEQTWERLIGKATTSFWPNRWKLMELVRQRENEAMIWDLPTTPESENAAYWLAQSLNLACTNLSTAFGHDRLPKWSTYQPTTMRHAGRFPGLGRSVVTGGVAESIFANKGEHGPTWKMIVSFEDRPRAWTMMPGGQSGDIASRSYDNLVDLWASGAMKPVQFNPSFPPQAGGHK